MGEEQKGDMKALVLSRYKTHQALRTLEFPFPCVINMGYGNFLDLGLEKLRRLPPGLFTIVNPPAGCRHAADKMLMKNDFLEAGIPSAKWWPAGFKIPNDSFPIVAKHRMGSRGTGVYLLHSPSDLEAHRRWRGDTFNETFVLEKYESSEAYPYEYRLYASQSEVFYALRKARKNGTPEYRKWRYAYEDLVTFKEENKNFLRPANWDDIAEACCNAVASVGLDTGACDVKVAKAEEGKPAPFFIIEINSAPSFGEGTTEKYLEFIPKLARRIHQTRQPYDMSQDSFHDP